MVMLLVKPVINVATEFQNFLLQPQTSYKLLAPEPKQCRGLCVRALSC